MTTFNGEGEGRYNGWTNYETWCVNLWIGNEEGSFTYWGEKAEELVRTDPDDLLPSWCKDGWPSWHSPDQERVARLADAMKEEIEAEGLDTVSEGLFADLLGAALSEVEWLEIAEGFIVCAKEAVAS